VLMQNGVDVTAQIVVNPTPASGVVNGPQNTVGTATVPTVRMPGVKSGS